VLLCIMALAALQGAAWAQPLQSLPPLTAPVMDFTGTLTAEQKQALHMRLQAFEQARGTQIVVLMVATTAPEDITDYTQRLGDAWKIGRKDVGDGLLLVIAKDQRTLRIAPAKSLEGAVPDLAARRVIQNTLVPRFREGDYAGGIDAGLSELMGLITAERLPEPDRRPGPSALTWDWNGVLVFLFVAVPVLGRLLRALLGRKMGALFTGAGIGALAWWLGAGWALSAAAAVVASVLALLGGLTHWSHGPLGGRGRSGGWSSGGGRAGGGFRSGGGGNFGGGGASGRW
jgi:uncharacterized protein